MPKISKNSIRVHHKDIEKLFDVDIMYNQRYKFYAKIPDEFRDIVIHYSDNRLKELSLEKIYKGKYSSGDYSFAVCDSNEQDCLNKMKVCLKELIGESIEKRDVIIVFYDPRDITSFGHYKYNKKHPLIGYRFGLTYAVETKVGEDKVYSIYTEYESFGRKKTNRQEINLMNERCIVIPDTHENREVLEALYSKMVELKDKLKEFTNTPEDMLQFIASGIKMLE